MVHMPKALASSLLLFVSFFTSLASAQDPLPPPEARPTSGEASLLSARTLGTGEVMVAGAVGWPWLWIQLELAPTSTFNIGIRAAVLYGSPLMALQPGAGGELSVPTRIHLHGDENIDIAVFVTPAFTVGEAALVGEGGSVYASDLGWSTRLEAGGLFGIHLQERLTLYFGLGGHVGFVHTPGVGYLEAIGALFASAGIEGLISRDTMLFAKADGGAGIAPTRSGPVLFGQGTVPPLLRVSLGVAYLF